MLIIFYSVFKSKFNIYKRAKIMMHIKKNQACLAFEAYIFFFSIRIELRDIHFYFLKHATSDLLGGMT
jgi:hypothetical protein